MQQVKHRLRNILDKIGVDRRLKGFKLSRCDLTCNLYYERKADVQDRLDIFKKSFPIPITTRLSSVNIQIPMKNSKGANKHSWTIENKSKSCAFSVYDKSYELEKRHDIKIDEHILRLELRFGRSKITKLTKAKDWESQLIELGSQVENQQHKFLHRLHMTHFDPISLSELLDCINASRYREKTKKKLRRIAKRRTAAFRSQPSRRIVGLGNLSLLNCWGSLRRWGDIFHSSHKSISHQCMQANFLFIIIYNFRSNGLLQGV